MLFSFALSAMGVMRLVKVKCQNFYLIYLHSSFLCDMPVFFASLLGFQVMVY